MNEKIFLNQCFFKKTLRIRRELVESFLRHILDPSDSKSKVPNFSSTFGDKTEISVLGNRKIKEIQGILFMKTKVIDQFWETENRDDIFVRA